MDKHIVIIGAGYAGLTLALFLQQKKVQVTLFSNKTAEEIENSPLLNTVARHSSSIELEARLGRPVITSNQTVIWDALARLGWSDRRGCPGRLFATPAIADAAPAAQRG